MAMFGEKPKILLTQHIGSIRDELIRPGYIVPFLEEQNGLFASLYKKGGGGDLQGKVIEVGIAPHMNKKVSFCPSPFNAVGNFERQQELPRPVQKAAHRTHVVYGVHAGIAIQQIVAVTHQA